MKRQKRDMNDRAWHRGYQAGVGGKSRESCPHEAAETRQHWLSGWREGRSDQIEGFTGVSGIARQP